MRLECRGMSKILRNGVVVRSWCRFPRQVGAAAGTAGVIGVSELCSSVLAWASPHHPYYPTTYYLPPHHPYYYLHLHPSYSLPANSCVQGRNSH